jgi:hypothetical protein
VPVPAGSFAAGTPSFEGSSITAPITGDALSTTADVALSGTSYLRASGRLVIETTGSIEVTGLASAPPARLQLAVAPPAADAYHWKTRAPIETAAAIPATGAKGAITVADAALRLAIGQNPNAPDADGARPQVSAFQRMAADVNEDGAVNTADALAILRMAVRHADAPQARWRMVPESAAPDPQAPAQPLGLVGVLVGDVDGSWLPGLA